MVRVRIRVRVREINFFAFNKTSVSRHARPTDPLHPRHPRQPRHALPHTQDARLLSLPVSFGRHYEFNIVAYAAMVAEKPLEAKLKGVSVFCGHHLVEEMGVERPQAYEFCRNTQEISGE